MGYEADLLPQVTGAPVPPPAPPAWESDLVENQAPVVRAAVGAREHIRAGFQASAPGLAWRGRLPDLVMDPEHSKWWERALTGVTQVGAELPLMIPGAIAGGAAGTAVGAAVTGPGAPVGGVAGGILGAGAGMFAVPAAIRETLMQAYKSGEITTAAEFWNTLREIATTTAKEAVVGAATMGAGGIAARLTGRALAPAIGTQITVPTATRAIGAADVAAQIGAMTTMPAAFQGRFPDLIEIMDGAIVVGHLKAAHVAAVRIANSYVRTGKTPIEVVADAKADPQIAADLAAPETVPAAPPPSVLRTQETLFREVARMDEIEAKPRPTAADEAELTTLRVRIDELERQVGDRPPSSTEDGLRQIYHDVLRQMREAGRPDDESAHVAAIEKARYRARADRLGVDPWELYSEGKPGGPRIVGGEEPPPIVPPAPAPPAAPAAGESAPPAAPAAPKKPLRPISDPDIKQLVQMMGASEAGWETVGGKLDIARYVEAGGTLDEFGRPTKLGTVAFTEWVPRAEWWRDRPGPGKLNEREVRAAVTKALAGEKLTKRESRTIDYMTEVANHRADAQVDMGAERWDTVSRELVDEHLDPTTRNVVDADLVAKAAEHNPGAVERAAVQFEADDAGFISAIRRILSEPSAEAAGGSEAGQPGEGPQTLYQQAGPRFYSELSRQLQRVAQESASPEHWKGLVKNLKGVKRDEVQWSGLEEWLDIKAEQDKALGVPQQITKQQVLDFLAGNAVRVDEHLFGVDREQLFQEAKAQAFSELVPEGEFIRAWGERSNWRAEVPGETFPYEEFTNGPILARLIEPIAEARGEQTKHGTWQLPGGENYRELLITLPEKTPMPKPVDMTGWSVRTVDENRYTGHRSIEIRDAAGNVVSQRSGFRGTDPDAIRDLNDRMNESLEVDARRAAQFTSGHFDQPNVLAHVRFNERTDAEGKRVLFIEEIQSDWAQKGKREGIASGGSVELVNREFNRVMQELYTREEANGIAHDNAMLIHHPDLQRRYEALIVEMGKAKHGVPAAPFVGKTEAWVGLSLKRMIAWAIENGFDRVAWTRGEQQVERYTSALRKAVDEIEWKKTPGGVQLVGYKAGAEARSAANVPGRERIREELHRVGRTMNDLLGDRSRAQLSAEENAQLDRLQERQDELINQWHRSGSSRTKVVDTTEREDALSDAIGKSMADRIRNDPAQSGTISGNNIRVDDTGMAAFYDRIVPNVANDILKKLGGGKVKDIPMQMVKEPGTPIGDQNAIEYFVVHNTSIVDPTRDIQHGIALQEDPVTYWARFGVPAETVRQAVADFNAKKEAETTVAQEKQTGFDITSEMKTRAANGLALFQANRGSYQPAENLIRLFTNANKSTALHELGHSWLEEMKADARRPDAPAQLKADWETLRQELAIPQSGTISVPSHEQWAKAVERYVAEGRAPSAELEGVFARFRQWLLDIYHSLSEMGAAISPEMREVMDRMLATDAQLADARGMNIPRAYVPEARVNEARKIVPGFKAEQISMQPYADEIPKGPGEAPDNSHVNYKYINTPDDVKLTMQRMAEIDQEAIQKQRGGTAGVKSWEQANLEQAKYVNDILGGGEDTLRLLSPRDPAAGPDLRVGIMKKLMIGAAKDSARLRDVILEKGPNSTVQEQLEYMGSIERTRMLQVEFLGERAGLARAMNQLKDTTEGSGEIARMLDAIGYGTEQKLYQAAKTPAEQAAEMKRRLDEILLNYRGRTVYDIAKLHKEIGTLKGSYKFSKEITQASTWEQVVEGWKSSLLSGPVTHTTNLFGTGAFQGLRPAVDALAGVIGVVRGAKVGMGDNDRVSLAEPIARLAGWLGGVEEGLKVGYHTFMEGEVSGKTESFRQAIPGRAGELLRIPLRLMSAEDAIITTMYGRGELRTLAIRQAFEEKHDPRTREFAERVSYLLEHPTPEMVTEQEAQATRMSFNAPLGEKGIALQLFVNKWNLQWMIPFIRTPINITKEVARMSPFAPLVGEWRAAIAQGGVARDRAIAELTLGTGIMALAAGWAFEGNLSGSGDPDPGKTRGKAGVWQPGSILVGDTWYEIQRIQPMGTLLILAADMANLWDHMTEEEADKIPKLLSVAFANAVTNQTFLQGITNVVNAMSDPARFFPRFARQMAGSLVPNVIGQTVTMSDPLVREVNSMLEAIQARVPGLREDLLPKRDWLGAPIETKERLGVISPIRTTTVSDDKVRQEAARLNLSMAAAPKKTHLGAGTGKLGDVEFTPEERDTFAKVGGEMAHRILGNIVNAPGYDAIPDMVKRRIFAKVLTASHQVAAAAALPPEKRASYLQSISEKVAAELAPVE